MNRCKCLVIAASVCSGGLLSINVQAQDSFDVTPNYSSTQFGSTGGGWGSGDIPLPGGTMIGSTPLELDLTLTQTITLQDAGLGYNYGFGMCFSPKLPGSSDAFTFSIELLHNGALVTPDFKDDLAIPFTFGFDEHNPDPNGQDGLGVGSSTTVLAPVLTFNQIDILLSNSNPGGQGVTSFNVELGVVNGVPETPNTLALLSLGFMVMARFSRRVADGVRNRA